MENIKTHLNINSKASQLIFIIITLIATPIHEFGHWIGFQFSGISAKYSFIYVESINGSESLWGNLGGPAIGLLLALLGCMIVYIFKDRKYIYYWIYFTITMCFTRLLPYLLMTPVYNSNVFQINDEGLIAKMMSVPTWQIYGFFMIAFIMILFLLRLIQREYFYKCFKYAFVLYFIVMVFQIRNI
ncbi:MAG TPA: hypothetical protein DD730_14255 [Desulfosporosinus sp.]|jgi:hypothetical protein|nr:hypothetical protein [Desulfosporosinus sp.]